MAHAHDIPELDAKGLRHFGLTTGAIVALLFGGLLPWLFGFRYPVWPWAVFGVLATWALIAPATLRWVYRGWMRIGLLLSKVTTPVIMGAVFFLVISPMGLVMRLLGKDPLRRGFDAQLHSYRVPSKKASKESLERPF